MKEGATTTLVHVPSSASKAATQKASQKPAASSVVQQARAAAVPATASASSAQNGSNGVASNTDQAEGTVFDILNTFSVFFVLAMYLVCTKF